MTVRVSWSFKQYMMHQQLNFENIGIRCIHMYILSLFSLNMCSGRGWKLLKFTILPQLWPILKRDLHCKQVKRGIANVKQLFTLYWNQNYGKENTVFYRMLILWHIFSCAFKSVSYSQQLPRQFLASFLSKILQKCCAVDSFLGL